MPDELRLVTGFLLATIAAFACTPLAIAVATRTGFNDKPVGYKGHARPTPYLGGAVVLSAFLLGGLTVAGETRLLPIAVAALGLWGLGTVDDKVNLAPGARLVIEFGFASALWVAGAGWDVFGSPVPDLILTNLWLVGLMNAFNLMDNMDGAAVTVGAVTTAATGVLAFVEGDPALATLCFCMTGACLGFLPYNLAGPARIFLGDGGSLPVGFVVAATIIAVPGDPGAGWAMPLAALILAGLPLADTALVMISRRRAGIPLLTGGRDHLTHRLATRLPSARFVAVALGTFQALLGATALGVIQLGQGSIVSAASIWFAIAAAGVVLLESRTWAPERPPLPASDNQAVRSPQPRGEAGSPTAVEAGAILFIAIAFGLSPAFYGFYRVSVWGPIALGLLAILLGLVIARPAALQRRAIVASGALAFLWAWSLLSVTWAESAEHALVDSNRWLLYAALLTILVLVLRDDRLSKLLMGAATGAVLVFGAYLVVRLLGSAGPGMFLSGRLHEPLGYVNGQAGYLLLGVWPLVALAERSRNHVLAGAGIAGAVMLVGLSLLGETRAVVPAIVVSAVVLLAAVPGRRRRAWALVAVAGGVAVAAPALVEVYGGGTGPGTPDPSTLRNGVWTLLAASLFAGGVWATARFAASRLKGRSWAAASTAGLAALALAGVVGAVVTVGNPVDQARHEARAFKDLDAASGSQARSRFTSGGGNRYDYWRVAAGQFGDQPLKGMGAGNYDTTYFLERRTTEDVRQPHSLILQTMSELGVVGVVGLLAFLGAVLAGLVSRIRATGRGTGDVGLTVAAGGVFLVWLVHTSVDWLHLIPGVTGIALCGAAVLLAPWTRPEGSGGRSPARVATVVAASLVVLAGAVLVGRSALADSYRADAKGMVATDPAGALEKASDSLALDDEALPAYYIQAAAHARLDQYGPARASLAEAARREPHNFVPRALMGDLATRRGDLRLAAAEYRAAARLNPRDQSLRETALRAEARLQ